MSRVIAFSDVHLCTPETQLDIQQFNYNYDNIRKLLAYIRRIKPDHVVVAGDLTEPIYDSYEDISRLIKEEIPDFLYINDITHVERLQGNHDPKTGQYTCMIDNVVYEHGHRIIQPNRGITRDEYVEQIREATKNISYKLVHGHTHFPKEGNPLDLGSITFTGTYGEIIDGKMKLRSLY